MKTKLSYACYWLFIMFILTSCIDEMDTIDHEQTPDQDIELFFLPDPIKAIFQYDKSIDIYDRSKMESNLDQLYINRATKKILTLLMESGVKIKITKLSAGSEMKSDAYCKPGFLSAEIGFLSSNRITLENLLHELLHLYAYMYYKTYTDGYYPACEEYEVRVLTDLIMSRDFRGASFVHQGMKYGDALYTPYREWLNTIINTPNYNMDLFKIDFKRYGSICMYNLGFGDRTGYIGPIRVEDFNYYTPRLINTFWSGF